MKKILSVVLVLSLLLTLTATLSSCFGHKCEFSESWSYDDNNHWHACTGEECVETADLAAHTYNEGEITTAPTQEADGVKTFTCTVCGSTKTETVEFTGMTEEEWNAALDASIFENVSYKETGKLKANGVTLDVEALYDLSAEAISVKITMAGQVSGGIITEAEPLKEVRDDWYSFIKDVSPYENYEYDKETKTYKTKGEFTMDDDDSVIVEATLTFENGKLVKIVYTSTYTENNVPITVDSTAIFSKYGEVEVTIPKA